MEDQYIMIRQKHLNRLIKNVALLPMQKRCRQVFEFYVQLVLPSQLRFSRFQHVRKRTSFQTGFISKGEENHSGPVLSGPLESNLFLVDREQTNFGLVQKQSNI